MVLQKYVVTQKQYDGYTQYYTFIDDTIHIFPTNPVYLGTPFFKGHVMQLSTQ